MIDTERIYILEDLYNWDYPGTAFAVAGDPIGHSLSPIMYNTAFLVMARVHEKYKNWAYFKFNIPEQDLGMALKLFHKKQFLGISLTSPLKVETMKHATSIDEVAKKMGAINTLTWENAGYNGINTDGYGLEVSVKSQLKINLKGKDVIILGAGGAARAAAIQCLLSDCKTLWIGNRKEDRLNEILKMIGVMGKGKVNRFNLAKLPKDLPKTGLLINATSLGLGPNDPSPIDLSTFDSSLKVFEMIYNPAETQLLRIAKEKGMTCCNGLRMLVEQGAKALQIWTGAQEVPIETMWNALNESLRTPSIAR